MTSQWGAVIAFTVACVGTWVLTPLVARLAVRLGAVDHPDGRRKSQSRPVPRGGGVAVAVMAAAALLVALPFSSLPGASATWLLTGLLPAALILLAVGIIDDVSGLTGIYKLAGQMLAVSVLVAAGSRFDSISVFGLIVPLGSFCVPFTIFFCLGAINAFNLIDGADGLASSIGAIVCVTLGVITTAQGNTTAALFCFALAGGLLGFLRYNTPPASVYLGDTGSMLIGLVVSAVAVQSSIKQQAAFALAVPIAICAIPILDAAAAMIRRITTGQSVFTADRGHLHHALLLRGWTVRQTVAFIAGLTALTCAGALVSYFARNDLFAIVAAGGVFVTLAGARIFGHAEVALIASRGRSLARVVLRGRRRSGCDSESAIQVQGKRKWQVVWAALREAAPTYQVAGLVLQVSIPQLHESFYATWKRSDIQTEDVWRLTLPLVLDDRPIGKLTLVGTTGGRQAIGEMQSLFGFLESLESEIAEVATAGDTVADPEARRKRSLPQPVGNDSNVSQLKVAATPS